MYTIKVHSLKSSARIIGANDLAALAEKLELAGNANDLDTINANTAKLLEDLRAFKDKLAPLRGDDQAKDDDLEAVPENVLKDAYHALKEIIPQMDYDSVDMIITELKGYKLPEKDKDKLDQLALLLKQYDWEKMEQLIMS
jgi:HPt (histidine-containing phosphotransfer) domain-containing protein